MKTLEVAERVSEYLPKEKWKISFDDERVYIGHIKNNSPIDAVVIDVSERITTVHSDGSKFSVPLGEPIESVEEAIESALAYYKAAAKRLQRAFEDIRRDHG